MRTPLTWGGSDSDRALSVWTPILLEMMSNPHRRDRFSHLDLEGDDEDNNENNGRNREGEGEAERDHDMESIIRRRRSAATILQLLQGTRAGMLSESLNSEGGDDRDRDRESRDGERVILINPFDQTIILQGSNNSNTNPGNHHIGSFGDYFIGPSLDMLLQHLAENDPNRYGTPPAQKEAVEALPTVKVEDVLQCSVCLEDFEIGAEAKEMPCKHKFHNGCILPWLELHSSCPVCRYQLPSDESKLDSNGARDNRRNHNAESTRTDSNRSEGGGGDDRNEDGRWFSMPLLWPFNILFSSSTSGSQSSNGHSSQAVSPSSNSSTNSNPPSSHTHED